MSDAMNATKGESPSMLRQRWLETALTELRKYFAKAGHEVPENLRVSIGWGHGNAEKILGQCWGLDASSDKHHEIFVSPSLKDGSRILDVLVHEIVHAVVGVKAGHKSAFKQVALAMGLEGKMTATTAGPELREWAAAFVKKHGAYPAGSLNKDKGRKKQGTRLIKCECAECGYIARTTAKWIKEKGTPRCGIASHGSMGSDYDPDEEGEE